MNEFLNELSPTKFRQSAAAIWNDGYMGIDIARLLSILAIFVVAILLRKPIARLILGQIRRLSRHSGTPTPELVKELEPPLRLIPVILAALIVSEFLITNARLKSMAEDVTRSLVVFALFWALYRVVVPLFSALASRTNTHNQDMIGWGIRVCRILAVALGAAAVLEIWGIHVGTMLAGFGLAGAAVALGAQDVFKNMIAGIFIIGERRFQNGDWIKADGVVEGTVEMIGLRTTKVIKFDSAPVYVPNSQLSDTAVTNYAQMTLYRISWMVGLTYDTTNAQLQKIRDEILAYLTGSRDFVQPPAAPLLVRTDSFGDSAINVMVYCFVDTTDWVTWLKVKEALAYQIRTIVDEAGSDFAFPSQSLYVETLPKGTEVFPASAQKNPAPKPESGTG